MPHPPVSSHTRLPSCFVREKGRDGAYGETAAVKERANHNGTDEILLRRLVHVGFSRLLPLSPSSLGFLVSPPSATELRELAAPTAMGCAG
jgi:hypothetical protein